MIRNLRVLALVTDAYGAGGGIAQYNRDFLGSLASCSGIGEIDVLTLGALQAIGSMPPNVRQRTPAGGRLGYVLQATRSVLTGAYDLIFCGHLHLAPLAAALAAARRVPFVTQLHGIEIWGQLSAARRWAVERSHVVLCVSRDTRQHILARTGIDPERAIVLPNTVDPIFRPGDRDAARARFGLAGAGRILLTVGRLEPREAYKGHDRVIAALPSLLAVEPGLTYVIAGDGDDRRRLENLADAAGVSAAVRFLGFVPADDLPELYRAADVFVMPSTGEGFGIVYLEAMASGTPAVGLAAGGASDALRDGVLGHVASEATLACVIRKALETPLCGAPLSEAVSRHFGRPLFERELHSVMMAWLLLAPSEAGIGVTP